MSHSICLNVLGIYSSSLFFTGFRSLPIHDQSILLQSSVYPIVLLYLSKVYDVKTKTHNYFNFTKQEEAVILKLFPMLKALCQHFQHVGEMVTALKITSEEYALLAAILLCPSGMLYFFDFSVVLIFRF